MSTEHARLEKTDEVIAPGRMSLALAIAAVAFLVLGGSWLGVLAYAGGREVSLGIAPAGTRGFQQIVGCGPSGSTEVVALWRAEIRFHSPSRRPRR